MRKLSPSTVGTISLNASGLRVGRGGSAEREGKVTCRLVKSRPTGHRCAGVKRALDEVAVSKIWILHQTWVGWLWTKSLPLSGT